MAYQRAPRVLLTTLGAHETVSQSIYILSACTKVWLTKDAHDGTLQNVLQKSVEALVACNIFYNICTKRWLLTTNILILLTVISKLGRKDMRESKDTGYFHICTDGASISWMFQDDHDFIAGVNRIGICLLKTGGKVIAYVLMDNHVHFVLYGTMPQCKAFITLYKRLTGKWILTKYGISDYLRHLPTDILRIDTEERLLNTIAYIDRNPLIAGYSKLPGEYPWGSARYLFKEKSNDEPYKVVGNLSRRHQKEIFGTRTILPDNWKIDCSSMIVPTSFINIKVIESFFKSPIRYSYFLAKKLEGIVEQDLEHSQKTFIPDKDLRIIVKKLSKELFNIEKPNDLDIKSKLIIARKLRYDYASTVKQIARMIDLDRSTLDGYV